MKLHKSFVALLLIGLLFAACNMNKIKDDANKRFGDQHFKTAIALIELHKIRFGEYPPTLDSLQYLGDWDRIIFTSVKYERLDSGYALDLVNVLDGKPAELAYPDEFWRGIGLVRSNVKR